MRRLYPSAGTADLYPPAVPADPEAPLEADLDTPGGLAAAYAYPAARERHRPYLRANMVGSLDGAAHSDGRSAPLSSPADMRVFGTLRALADAIVVGAETVRRESYRPAKARKDFAAQRAAAGQSPAPAIAVVSRRLDLDFDAPLFRQPATPTVVLTCSAAPQSRRAAAQAAGARLILAGSDGVDPVRAVAELVALGHTRLLHEGGPRLLAQFAAAGVLDELCLTVAPLLVGGDAPRVMNGLPVPGGPTRFVPLSILEEDGYLFTRYVRG